MNAVTRNKKRTWRVANEQPDSEPGPMLDVLLALDQMLVEVSMHLYNVQDRDRSKIRLHNRRLHAAVRRHLPALLK